MSRNNKAATWLKRLVIAVCIGVMMLSAAVVAVQLNITGALEAALLALFACLTAMFFVRQFVLRREVEAARTLAADAALGPLPDRSIRSGGFERLGRDNLPSNSGGLSATDFPDKPDSKVKPVAARKEVASALGEDDLILFLQPIVTLPEKEPIYYQTLLRLKMANGTMLDPPQYRQVAKAGGLMSGIDRRNVTQSIRMLKTLHAMNKKAGLFCELSSESLKSGKDYDRIISLLDNNATLKDDLVIEITQDGYARAGSAGRKRLQAIATLGFRLCLSDVTDLKLNLGALRESRFDFLKIPATMLVYGHSDDDALQPATLASHAALHEMQLVATDVSREQDVPYIMDRDVLIAQGALFAEAKQVKAELLEED